MVASVVLKLACVLVLGGAVDQLTEGQTLVTRAAYGFIIGGPIQTLSVVPTFGFMMLNREAPDIGD